MNFDIQFKLLISETYFCVKIYHEVMQGHFYLELKGKHNNLKENMGETSGGKEGEQD